MAEAETFVQYKGTDICMDWSCACTPVEERHKFHVDGYFASAVQCPDCGAIYVLPQNLALVRDDSYETPLILKYDEDEGNQTWGLK